MEIELPNGQIAEFPDGTPNDVIESSIKSYLLPKVATQSEKDEAFNQIKQQRPRMPDFLIKALMPLAVSEAEKKINPMQDNSGTATGAFLRSAIRTPLESANNLASLIGLPVDKNAEWPSFIAESESDKSHPFAQLGGNLAGFLPIGIGSVNALRAVPAWGKIADKSAGTLLRRAPVLGAEGAAIGYLFSPDGERTSGALLGGALGVGASAIPNVSNAFSALRNRVSSIRNLDKLKNEGKITAEQYNNIVSNEESLQALAKEQGLGSDVSKMESELPTFRQKEQKLREEILNNPKVNLSNRLGSPTGEELVPNAEKLLQESNSNLLAQEGKISDMIGIGNAHRKRVADILNPLIESRQNEIGKGYDNYIKNLKDKKVILSNSDEAKKMALDLKKLISEGKFDSKEAKELGNKIVKFTSGDKEIPADKFVAAYRTLRRSERETRSSAYGKSPEDHNRLINKADIMDEEVKRMEKIINEGLGEGNLAELNSLNRRYREEIAPLFRNDFFNHIRSKSKAPSNMMEQLTNEPYIRSTSPNKITGTKILNDYIRNDPELLSNVIGERFAGNPKDILQWDETANEFIKHFPKLVDEISSYKNLTAQRARNIENLDLAKKQSRELKSESERIERGFKEDQKKQSEYEKNISELRETQEKIQNLERMIPQLKQNSKSKGISLKEKIEIENKIKKTEDDISKLKNKAIITVAAITSIVGTGAGLSKSGIL